MKSIYVKQYHITAIAETIVRAMFRSYSVCAIALAILFTVGNPVQAEQVAMTSLGQKGYIFLHPMFQSLPWNQTLKRLDLVLPDTLSELRIKSFDVSFGLDNAVAVFTASESDFFIMPVLYEKLVAPCFDHALTFDNPAKVVLSGLSLAGNGTLYVVRDSIYSTDSVRIVVPSPEAPLRLQVATVQRAGPSVTRIDTITLAERHTGQQIMNVAGATNAVSLQDTGLWVCGSGGLVRYIPYTNNQFGDEAVRDLDEATVSVTHTNGAYAVTTQGRIFRRSVADTFFTFADSASGVLRRVYDNGAVGDNGLFKENVHNSWKADTTFGTAAYRYANFIRRPGGLGVELLDSLWAYSVFTYRDTTTRIAATQPASLSTNINGTPFIYDGPQQLDITVMLDDPDSNFSDYSLYHVRGSAATSLKNDGSYSIAPLSDSADCHIGSLKMTSGRLRLALTGSQLTVMHDCGVGALDPTCLACYWKKYDFQIVRSWRTLDTIKIQTGQHLLRLVNGASVTLSGPASAGSRNDVLAIRFASGHVCNLRFPLEAGTRVERIAIHDLTGRTLAAVSLQPLQRDVQFPRISHNGVLILCCSMSNGTKISTRIPVVSE